MTELEARRILHLEGSCSPAEARQAYLDLVRVWHPDRFQSSARLRRKAGAKLREINEAYALLQRASEKRQGSVGQAGDPAPRTPKISTQPAAAPQMAGGISPIVVLAASSGGLLVAFLIVAPLLMRTVPPSGARGVAIDGELSGPQPAPARAPIVPRAPAPSARVAAEAPDPLRPDSAAEIVPPHATGRGTLVIQNVSDRDGVVVLADGARHVRAVYVRAGHKISVLDVIEGRYRVLVALGRQWRAGAFVLDATYHELARSVEAEASEGAVWPPIDVLLTTEMRTAKRIEPFRVSRDDGRASDR